MNESKLRKIQLCQLEILKEVDRICKKYEIKYWLAYGTFLGAVRHQGFIPWDDDLDIHMRMKDFKRFEKVCKSELKEQYFLQTPKTQSNTKWLFYKVRKNETLMIEPGLEESAKEIHSGVWIDIFPLIDFSKTNRGQEKQIRLLRKLQGLRYWHSNPKDKTRSIKIRIRDVVISWYEKVLWMKVISLGNVNSEQYLVIENEFYSDKTSKHIKRATIEKSVFNVSSNYRFENGLFSGISEYDLYLKQMYGEDYMTPKRFGEHLPDYSQVIVE